MSDFRAQLFEDEISPGGGALGILYADDFDLGEAPAPVVVEAPVVLSAADLERAHKEGFARGREVAREEFEASQTVQRNAAVREAAEVLARAEQQIVARAQVLAEALACAMLALCHTMLEEAMSARAPDALARLVAVVLPPLRGVPDVTISVHPFMLGSLSASMKEAAQGYGGAVTVTADDTLPESDIRIDWPGGQARRLESDFRQRLRAALLPFTEAVD